MDGIEIRPIREDEFPAILALVCVAFGEGATEEDAKAYRAGFPFDRSLCAFEEGRLVASSGVLSMELTLPGGSVVPMGGVTWIATLPTHRRRGLLRRLMAAQITDMTARGEILSGLGASEANIYGRFGYGPATHFASFGVERAFAAFTDPQDTGAVGRIRLLGTDEAASQLPPVYESLRLRQPGAVGRTPGMWAEYLGDAPSAREGAGAMHHCVHETIPGVPDGYVSYRVKNDWKGETPANEVQVVELQAADRHVYRALWGFLLDMDLCQTITCWRGRVDEPLRWLLADRRRFKVDAVADFLWLRLLDVPRALAARTYEVPGELVLEVTDPFPTLRRTCYLLRAESGAEPATGPEPHTVAECTLTTRAPDLTLTMDMLGAVYLGGVSFATLAAAGKLRELTPGAVKLADRMFSSLPAPYCVVEF